jgi:hypothetical protein
MDSKRYSYRTADKPLMPEGKFTSHPSFYFYVAGAPVGLSRRDDSAEMCPGSSSISTKEVEGRGGGEHNGEVW